MNDARRCFWVCLALLALVPVAASAAPRLEVVGGTKQDLGFFAPGTYNGEVYITNVGDTTLSIVAVRSSCGCLYGTTSCRSLEPGDTCAIQWHMAAGGRRGENVKTVTVETNDSLNSHTVISFRWRCRFDLDGEAGRTYILLARDTATKLWRGELKLQNVGTDTLSVAPPTVEGVWGMEVKQVRPSAPVTLLPNESFTVAVVAERERLDSAFKGAGQCQLVLKTSGRFTPEMRLTVVITP